MSVQDVGRMRAQSRDVAVGMARLRGGSRRDVRLEIVRWRVRPLRTAMAPAAMVRRAAMRLVAGHAGVSGAGLPGARRAVPTGASPASPAIAMARPPMGLVQRGSRAVAAVVPSLPTCPARPLRKLAGTLARRNLAQSTPLVLARPAAITHAGAATAAIAATWISLQPGLTHRECPRVSMPASVAPRRTPGMAPVPAVRHPVAPRDAAAATLPAQRLEGGSPTLAGTRLIDDMQIDSAQIGRWLTEHLTEQATRPPSGVSGLDDRLTPLFAGMVGV